MRRIHEPDTNCRDSWWHGQQGFPSCSQGTAGCKETWGRDGEEGQTKGEMTLTLAKKRGLKPLWSGNMLSNTFDETGFSSPRAHTSDESGGRLLKWDSHTYTRGRNMKGDMQRGRETKGSLKENRRAAETQEWKKSWKPSQVSRKPLGLLVRLLERKAVVLSWIQSGVWLNATRLHSIREQNRPGGNGAEDNKHWRVSVKQRRWRTIREFKR